MRFTLHIPSFIASIADPDAWVYSTEPSFVEVTLAPYVRDGWISWWVRDSEVRLGHLEVNVAYGFFDWLGVIIWLIPGLNFIFLGIDAAADSIATSDVNDSLTPPDIGNLQGLLVTLMDYITAHHSQGMPRPIEAAHLRAMQFTIWWRAREGLVAPTPAQAQLNLLPSFVAFGAATAGAAPLYRNVLLTSDGNAPSLIEGLRLVGGAANFRIESPPAWPQVLTPGNSLIIGVSFTPLLPAGFRSQQIEVIANGGQKHSATVSALVRHSPEPLLRLRPERLQFGVVDAGSVRVLRVEVFNDGARMLELAAPQLDTGSLPAGMLTLDTPGAQSIPAGGAGHRRAALWAAVRWSEPGAGDAHAALQRPGTAARRHPGHSGSGQWRAPRDADRTDVPRFTDRSEPTAVTAGPTADGPCRLDSVDDNLQPRLGQRDAQGQLVASVRCCWQHVAAFRALAGRRLRATGGRHAAGRRREPDGRRRILRGCRRCACSKHRCTRRRSDIGAGVSDDHGDGGLSDRLSAALADEGTMMGAIGGDVNPEPERRAQVIDTIAERRLNACPRFKPDVAQIDRAAKQRCQRAPDAPGVDAGEIGACDQRLGRTRVPLIASLFHSVVPPAVRLHETCTRHGDLGSSERSRKRQRPAVVAVAGDARRVLNTTAVLRSPAITRARQHGCIRSDPR